ncbi:hypothetical protein Phou_040330 [Phytohabitans houttuyneae]|uniref:Uncharacterized protein n=1 Tax=Phytohabitans houttuyneae TaxID=1076126 RepID=A0A6V8K3X2_9ACTN|nr:hypothetical protein Phou_040330 [Phytohabitans houttuyneae]
MPPRGQHPKGRRRAGEPAQRDRDRVRSPLDRVDDEQGGRTGKSPGQVGRAADPEDRGDGGEHVVRRRHVGHHDPGHAGRVCGRDTVSHRQRQAGLADTGQADEAHRATVEPVEQRGKLRDVAVAPDQVAGRWQLHTGRPGRDDRTALDARAPRGAQKLRPLPPGEAEGLGEELHGRPLRPGPATLKIADGPYADAGPPGKLSLGEAGRQPLGAQ